VTDGLVMFFYFTTGSLNAERCETLPHDRYLGALYGPSPKIRRPSPKNWGQNMQNFYTTSRLWSWISPEHIEISKIGKHVIDRERFLPRSAKEVRW